MKKIIIMFLWIIALFIPLLNIFLVYKITRPTLANWTSHKSLMWVTNIEKVKLIYCTGDGLITLWKGDFNIFTTCTDNEDYQKFKHLWNAEIKYIRGYEDDHLVIQLWNTKKLNKIYLEDSNNVRSN